MTKQYGGAIMVDLKALQKQVYQNKIEKGFNVTNIEKRILSSIWRNGRSVRGVSEKER